MEWRCVYSSCILTFYLLGRTLSFPNRLPCKALSLYPSNVIGETSAKCHENSLNFVLADYCDELRRLQEEICGGNFTDLLNSIPPEISSVIINVPFTETTNLYHCEDFNSLNETLHKFYLDKPGFAKKLSGKYFCAMFCESNYAECETLLRTYWIMKILQDYKEKVQLDKRKNDSKEKDQHDKGKNDPGHPAQDSTRKPDSKEKDQHDKGKNDDGHPTQDTTRKPDSTEKDQGKNDDGHRAQDTTRKPAVPDQTSSKLPGTGAGDNEGNSKTPAIKNDDTSETERVANEITIPAGDDEPDKTNHKSTEPATKLNKKDGIDTSEKQPNEKGNPIVPTDKPKQDKPDGKVSPKKQEETTPNSEAIEDPRSTDKPKDVKANKPQTKEIARGSTTQSLGTSPKDDGKQENNKVEGVGSQDPDKISGEADKYPPDEPDSPVPDIEPSQSGSPDENNSDKKTQHDGPTVEMQPADVPQLPFPDEEDGHFYAYFLAIIVLCIAGYLVFHNKQKIIALIVEGRHERRRRPNNGAYKRLDSKDGAKATSHVIF